MDNFFTNQPDVTTTLKGTVFFPHDGVLDGLKQNSDYEPSCFRKEWVNNPTKITNIHFKKCPLKKLPWHGLSCKLYATKKKEKYIWRHKLPCHGSSQRPVSFNLINKISLQHQPAATFFFSLVKHCKTCDICSHKSHSSDPPEA